MGQSFNIKSPEELINRASELQQTDYFVIGRGGLLYGIAASLVASQGEEVEIQRWVSTTAYNTSDIVLYADKIWESLQDTNLNHSPVEGVWWKEISRSESNGFGRWAAGLFTKDPSIVVRTDGDGLDKLYSLRATLPFNSTDFQTEYGGGSWQLIGYDKKVISITNGDLSGYVYTYNYPDGPWTTVEVTLINNDGYFQNTDIIRIIDSSSLDIDFGYDITGTWTLILTIIK